MNFWLDPGTARQDRRARVTGVVTGDSSSTSARGWPMLTRVVAARQQP
jgi:hypothetical protein